jgi:hypothetical protein
LTSDSDLASFHIAPDPEVENGDNVIVLEGTATDAGTAVRIKYYDRYIGI